MTDRFSGIWEKTTGPAWIARHGLTGAQYQVLFDSLVPQGYRPTIVDVYDTGAGAAYQTLFEKRGGDFIARHGLDPAEYQALFSDSIAKGYRPLVLSGCTIDGAPRYVAVFEKRPGPAFAARHGMTSADYQAFITEQVGKGFRPVIISAFSTPSAGSAGAASFIAYLEQKQTGAMELRHDLTLDQLTALSNDLLNKGYRANIISGYAINNTARYLAVFEKRAGGDDVLRAGLDGNGYQSVWNDLVPKGYRPVSLSAFAAASHIRIELSRVHCGNTEDKSGADSLYIVGAASDGFTSRGVLTKPMQINDDQEKTFDPAQALIFDGDLHDGSSVKVGLRAYDEDFGKDWNKYKDTVTKITNAVESGFKQTNDPRAATAAQILDYGLKAFSFFASLDKDDKLGEYQAEISLTGLPVEERIWHFFDDKGTGFSTWSYSVVVRLTRS